jgi:uncharacterized protein
MFDVPDIAGDQIAAALNCRGYATLPLLPPRICRDLAGLYQDSSLFRKRIIMHEKGYGRGEYKYFEYTLPPLIDSLRRAFYRPLAAVANEWCRVMAKPARFPGELDDYLVVCHAGGQTRATPLLLHYEAGGFNCLHQDLYGDLVFPLQMTVLLSEPERAFTGGEFLLVEELPDAQSRGMVVPLRQGDAVIFPTRERPLVAGADKRMIAVRHGVSEVRHGVRQTLGLIFHDAA